MALFYSTKSSLPELSSRFSEQLRIFKQTFTSFRVSFDAGSDSLLDFKILAPLLLSAPTDDELQLACEMKTAKPLIPSKWSRSSASAQSTFARMDDALSKLWSFQKWNSGFFKLHFQYVENMRISTTLHKDSPSFFGCIFLSLTNVKEKKYQLSTWKICRNHYLFVRTTLWNLLLHSLSYPPCMLSFILLLPLLCL